MGHRSPPEHDPSIRSKVLDYARSLWLRLPQALRYRVWTLAGPRWQNAYARQLVATPSEHRSEQPGSPLVIAGLFSTANGIGEGARATYRALEAAGLSPIAVDLSTQLAPVDLVTDIPCQSMPESEDGTLILQLNGPEIMAALQHLGMHRGRRWYTIGYWAWELPTFPRDWDRAFRFLSEIWTISDFTGAALRSHSNAPEIKVFSHAISAPKNPSRNRQLYAGSETEFVFLTMADGMSSLTRKNPFAAIQAFKSAFGDDPSRRLVVKTRNLDHKPQAKTDIFDAIGSASNIVVLDESLSEEERWELLNSVDCFVSLHRSEGFGLVLAEAMSLGKPVVCTNWSGNMDFTTIDTAALVASERVPCQDPYGIYTDTSAHWAEIDHQDAVTTLRRIASDAAYRTGIGDAAKRHIAKDLSVEKIGSRMAARLAAIPVSSFD